MGAERSALEPILRRRARAPRVADLRRVALALAALAVASGAWRVAREPLIVLAATYSVGDGERRDLLIAALRARAPGFPSAERLPLIRERANRPPWLFASERSGLHTWCQWYDTDDFYAEWANPGRTIHEVHFFDCELRPRGAARVAFAAGPHDLFDVDGDGRVEISCRFQRESSGDPNSPSVSYDMIVTIGERENYVRAVVAADRAKRPNYRVACGIFDSERAEYGGDWRLVDRQQGRRGRFRFDATTAVHVRLRWELPGAAPRVVHVARPDEIIVWSPPGGSMEIPIDADLRAIAESVVPLPRGFGRWLRPAWQVPTTTQEGDE